LPPSEEGCGPVECLVTDLVDELEDPGLLDGGGGGGSGGGGLGEILP
jgi:hypothetical protein